MTSVETSLVLSVQHDAWTQSADCKQQHCTAPILCANEAAACCRKLLEDPKVTFAGYKIPHPLEYRMIYKVPSSSPKDPEKFGLSYRPYDLHTPQPFSLRCPTIDSFVPTMYHFKS